MKSSLYHLVFFISYYYTKNSEKINIFLGKHKEHMRKKFDKNRKTELNR
nr:MAG TPA: hypothetical protein [Caudoviricetes sp.]